MVRIPLRDKRGEVRAEALVDDADGALANRRWALHSAGYAYRLEDRIAVYMHREVLGLAYGDGVECDHLNRNRLDNRRTNLRAGTTAENRRNVRSRPGTSQYRGVYYSAARGKWYAQVKHQGKRHTQWGFPTEAEANEAAIQLRREIFGLDG